MKNLINAITHCITLLNPDDAGDRERAKLLHTLVMALTILAMIV
jgi:hypothetical protein